jgi:hypothetical protein
MRGTEVILTHLQGGLCTHLVLFRIWTTSIHNTKSWYNLPKHVFEVLQKEFWKSNERNESYTRLNLPIPPSRGGRHTFSAFQNLKDFELHHEILIQSWHICIGDIPKKFWKSNERNVSYLRQNLQGPLQGGFGTHSTLYRIWTASSYTTKSWYNLQIHVTKVLQKKVWKSNERNMSYECPNIKDPLQGGSEHTQRFTESERLWVTPSNLANILKNMYLRYCKKNFENRMRGTKVIHYRLRYITSNRGSNQT